MMTLITVMVTIVSLVAGSLMLYLVVKIYQGEDGARHPAPRD